MTCRTAPCASEWYVRTPSTCQVACKTMSWAWRATCAKRPSAVGAGSGRARPASRSS